MGTKTQRLLKSLKRQPEKKTPIATDMFLPNPSGDRSKGKILTTPTTDYNPVNKKYVDEVVLWEKTDSLITPKTPAGLSLVLDGEMMSLKRTDGDYLKLLTGTNNVFTWRASQEMGYRASIHRFKNRSGGVGEIEVSKISCKDGTGGRYEDDGNNLGIFIQDGGDVGIGTATPGVKLDVNAKGGMNDSGAFLVKLTNKTGSNSVAGELVNAHTTTENAVEQSPTDSPIAIGAFLESGVADGSEAWIAVGGIATVKVDASTTVAVGDWVKVSSNTAGRVESSGSEVPGANHFREVGHALEDGGNDELIKIAMHFN